MHYNEANCQVTSQVIILHFAKFLGEFQVFFLGGKGNIICFILFFFLSSVFAQKERKTSILMKYAWKRLINL